MSHNADPTVAENVLNTEVDVRLHDDDGDISIKNIDDKELPEIRKTSFEMMPDDENENETDVG